MDNGNLQQKLQKTGPFCEQQIKIYCLQILCALKFLHKNKIIHKDLKCSNILLDQKNQIKISDFGCSKQINKTLTNLSNNFKDELKGSIPWMAPEVIKQEKYGVCADIWSFGCTVLEMAKGDSPWSEYKFDNPVTAIMTIGLSNQLPQIPQNISQQLKQFIIICLNKDIFQRPNCDELLKHQFLNFEQNENII